MLPARALRAGRGADPAAAGRRPRGGGRPHRPGEREDGGRAGPAHPARAAGHHRHQLPRDRLRRPAAAAAADRLDADQRLHPERAVDGRAVRQRRVRDHRAAAQARHRGHAREPQQADARRPTSGSRRSTPRACRTARRRRSTASTARSPASTPRSSATRARALLAELRPTNDELKTLLANPAWSKLPEDASAAVVKVRELVSDPKLQQTVAASSASLVARRPHPRRRRADLATTIEQPAPDHRQPARPHRGREALSVEPAVRRAPETAAARPAMNRFARFRARARRDCGRARRVLAHAPVAGQGDVPARAAARDGGRADEPAAPRASAR